MTDRNMLQLDAQLRRHFLAVADDRSTASQLADVLDRTRGVRQRPEWIARLLSPALNWPALAGRRQAVLAIVVVLVLLVALVASLLLIARPRPLIRPLWFATAAIESGEGRLYAVEPGGGAPRLVFDRLVQGVHVSPDGSQAIAEGLDGRIVIVSTTGLDTRTIGVGDPPSLGRAWDQPWAPDSRAAAFVSGSDLWIVSSEGTVLQVIGLPPGWDHQLSWSPDNRTVLLAMTRELANGATAALLFVDASTGAIREAGSGIALVGPPGWSDDGRRVAAVIRAPDTHPTVAVIDATTLHIDVRVEDVVDGLLHWAPDSTSIYWVATSGPDTVAIRRLPVAGGSAVLVAEIRGGPVWSPDRRRVAWIDSSDQTLWVMDLADAVPRRLAGDIAAFRSDGWPQWSPDATWLAFPRGEPDTRSGGRVASVWIMRADGTGERRLVERIDGLQVSEVDW